MLSFIITLQTRKQTQVSNKEFLSCNTRTAVARLYGHMDGTTVGFKKFTLTITKFTFYQKQRIQKEIKEKKVCINPYIFILLLKK